MTGKDIAAFKRRKSFFVARLFQGNERRKNRLPVPIFRYCEFVFAVAVKDAPKFVQTAKLEEAWSW